MRLTRAQIKAAGDALGYELARSTVAAHVDAYAELGLPDLRERLRAAEAKLEARGGRDVWLADAVDGLRIAVAARESGK